MRSLIKIKSKILEYFELIKFEHTIFALPFALSGMLLAAPNKFPEVNTFILVLFALVGGRTAAMSLNRLIDAEIDKKNPRTSNRAIPTGRIKKSSAFILAIVSFAVMILAVWQLPLICKQLLPPAILILVVYSFAKRFTHLSHLVLGGALGAAASGGWLAVSGEFSVPVVLWGISVVFWVAGFDIIYAIQDIDFDRGNKLFSIPAWLGVKKSLLLSKIFHLFTIILLIILSMVYTVGIFYRIGIVFVAGMLFWEHFLLKENNLSNINAAFFNINGYVSIGIFVFILLDKVF
ncbi:MAG: UbiA-like polyprenyltransferase [bacterium]